MLSILFVLAAPVIANEAFKGFRCENECPLAQQANSHRAFGTEALAASTAVRAYVSASVEKNLLKI
ncbi:MAG: hypothetical protein ABIP42_14350 [Planctomycetota bacterium]